MKQEDLPRAADLVMEGVVRSYNLAEPLLKVNELGPHLLRTLVVLRGALAAVPMHQWYPVCQRLFARLAYEITRLGENAPFQLRSSHRYALLVPP